MDLRSAGVPDEPTDDPIGDDTLSPAVVSARTTGAVAFAVPTRVLVAKFGGAAVIALASVFAQNRTQLIVGLLAAIGLAGYAARDLIARQRLVADATGVEVVHGLIGRHRLAWAEIERVRVDDRSRFGATTQLLELDAGNAIFLYSRFELGVDPVDAAEALEIVRRRRRPADDQ